MSTIMPRSFIVADDVAAEVGEAAVASGVARRVAPVVRVDVRQRHVARAVRVEVAQGVERVFDGVAAFDADEDRDLAVVLRGADAGRVGAERQLPGAAADFLLDDVEETVGERRRAAVGVRRRDVGGEEGGGDAALLERPEVALRLGVVLVDVDVVPQHAVRACRNVRRR